MSEDVENPNLYTNNNIPVPSRVIDTVLYDIRATQIDYVPFSDKVRLTGEWTLAQIQAVGLLLRSAISVESPEFLGYSDDPENNAFVSNRAVAFTRVCQMLKDGRLGVTTLAPENGDATPDFTMEGDFSVADLDALSSELPGMSTSANGNPPLMHKMAMIVKHNYAYTMDVSVEAIELMVAAGINPYRQRRVWDKFIEHHLAGWSLPRILCAANQYVTVGQDGNVRTLVIPGPRHMSKTMALIARELGLSGTNQDSHELQPWRGQDQGFIDQHDNFYTREEAWVVAMYNKQLDRPTGWLHGRLYSENLY